MDQANTNYAFAATFADQLAAGGVAGVCISPGSRSAPLAIALARQPGLRVFVHVDERSAGFFALGLARATGRPAVLLCTSGTAAAEYHPAVVEAAYGRVPLLVLTADRPPELIDVGANQAIDQRALYGSATRWFFDPGPPVADAGAGDRWRRLAVRALTEAMGPPAGPVHLNLPFREPLVPAPGQEPAALPATRPPARVLAPEPAPTAEMVELVADAVRAARRPVLVAGGLPDGARLRAAVGRLGLPVLAEPTSQLRAAELPYDALLRDARWAGEHRPDLVLRLGAPMTSRPLNQWLAGAERTILVDPGGGWPDPDLRATEILRCDPQGLLAALPPTPDGAWQEEWRVAGRLAADALDAALDRAPLFEAHAVRALAAELGPEGSVFVGSSMPIRDVDTFWPAAPDGPEFVANRGASGIDGLVSTALGLAAARSGRTALLVGDLGLYHDMNGLWAVRRHGLRPLLVVLDNGGGGIFSFLPQAAHEDVFEEVFGTPLDLRLEDAARLYGLRCAAVDRADQLRPALREALAVETASMVVVRFRREASVAGHRACWDSVSAALRPAAPRSEPGT